MLAPFHESREGDRDTGPLSVKEAMALGTPAIASRFMGLKEIVDDKCGLLVEPKDAKDLAETAGAKVMEQTSKESAQDAKSKLEAAGATVELV